jgi:Uma2 family endonuclease
MDERKYTAEDFYEWIAVRRNKGYYTSIIELLLGNISEMALPAFRYQNIRGNLYFAIKSFLKARRAPYQLYFSPMEVEMKKMELLDSVVMPDLFLIGKDEVVLDNVYHGVPDWIIEIVSPATASRDYIDKAQLYQYHGVSEYWIINDWKRQVMVLYYKKNAADAKSENVESYLYDFDERISVRALPGLEIIMDDVLKL